MNDVSTESSAPHADGLYVKVWAALLLLTAITVGITHLDMKAFAVVTALIIASVKASLVLLYFMHLRFESRLLAVVMAVALGTFTIFLALTFADVHYRFY